MSFAKRLKTILRERELSGSQFAKLVGVSSMAVSNWQNGTLPRPESMARIAQVLGVTEKFLISGSTESPPAQRTRTVAQIIDEARREIAAISGMSIDRVRVKVEYGSD